MQIQNQKQDSHVKLEAEVGVRLPEAKRQGKILPLEASEGAWPCRCLDFRPPDFKTIGEEISVVLSLSDCGTLLWMPQEINTQPYIYPFHFLSSQLAFIFVVPSFLFPVSSHPSSGASLSFALSSSGSLQTLRLTHVSQDEKIAGTKSELGKQGGDKGE